ncbi:MAG: PA14 domain-containing protein [Planctomycetota bacterium]|jgi:hypothetical protein
MYRKLFCLVSSISVLGLVGMAGASEGLIGEYYHGSASGAWDDLAMKRLDPTVDFSWGNGSPEPEVVNVDNFKVRWTGEVVIPSAGTYTFHTQTDDGVRLWVNDILVLENWTDHGSTHDSGDIDLEGGRRYPIKLEWYENGGGAICQLSWESPRIARQIIPSSYLWVGGDRPNAYNPTPDVGALYPDTWVTLTWSPGDFAVSHDVYFGDKFDDVDAGTPGAPGFQGNQTSTELTIGFPGFAYPDGLVPGTTYYWRVDEVNDADPSSPWKGDIWSFSIPPKTAFNPDPADGAGYVDPNAVFTWTPGFNAKLHTVYMGTNFDEVSNAAGGVPMGFATYSPGPLELEKVYYWRVDEFDPPFTHKGDVWGFTTPGAVGNPQPANGAVGVQKIATLSWTSADNATSHELYFGADADAVKNATTTSLEYVGPKALGAESYDPGGLAWNSSYAWRVDEVYPTETVKGLVWSFMTADFILVDDFESYNDVDPPDPNSNRIFEAWIDGFGTTDNGALVGNELPPYAEQGIVHGGTQSMPYLYDNNLKTSEATLTLVYPRDWTEEGVTKLSLWFRGASANAADRMFVALGNAVVYHDDPAVTQIVGWNQWVVDLTEFAGVDLTNVNTITIGIGTKGSPAAGGTGTMYFDDIRLIR